MERPEVLAVFRVAVVVAPHLGVVAADFSLMERTRDLVIQWTRAVIVFLTVLPGVKGEMEMAIAVEVTVVLAVVLDFAPVLRAVAAAVAVIPAAAAAIIPAAVITAAAAAARTTLAQIKSMKAESTKTTAR